MRVPPRFRRRRQTPARRLGAALHLARTEIRQGRFQRSMAVIAAFAAIVSGFEAYAQHQRGAFANKLMWTPVWLVPPMVGSAGAALFSERAARRVLPLVSLASLLDGIIGFGAHLRGIARLPGGFKLGQYNIVMGPPIFAPLLVGSAGVLGLLAGALRPEEPSPAALRAGNAGAALRALLSRARDGRSGSHSAGRSLEAAVAHGRFQRLLAATAAIFAGLAGGEAYFEHRRGSYNATVMWTPVWVTPVMVGAAVAAIRSETAAHHVLPWASALAFADGMAGFGLHLRGLARMAGDFGDLDFKVTYGPPLFAPLLFCAVGLLGMIASLLRRRSG